MAIVTIVGSGLMGTAVAFPLSDNGHTVRLVGTHLDAEIVHSCKTREYHPRLKRALPPGVQAFYIEEIEAALDGAEIIVSGVNSLGAHWIGRKLGPYLKPGQKIIAITKGLELNEQGQLTILPDVLRSELPEPIRDQVTYTAVGGPCIAGELAGRRHSLVVFGSRQVAAAKELAAIFRTPYYHIWTTSHLKALEFSAALKNAYTLGVGLTHGLLERAGGVDDAGAHMHNLAAGLFGASTNEIAHLLHAIGLNTDFAHGLPGAGDLFVTAMGGRTIRFGKLLGLGHSLGEAMQIMAGETLEAVYIIQCMAKAIPLLEQRGLLERGDLPFMRALVDIVVHGQAVDLPLDAFFSRNGEV